MSDELEEIRMELSESILYDYDDGNRTFVLTNKGTFYVRQGGKCTVLEWYKDGRTGKRWIPARRRTFVSLVKQSIREGDFDP